MTLARRILSPLIVLVGFALVAAALYPVFVTLTPRAAQWPLVAVGASIVVLGLLAQAATLRRRLIGAAIALVAVGLFILGYPLYGITGAASTSWLWIPAIMLGASAMIVARGRSWWALLAAIGLGIVYIGIGLFLGFGPVGWWPIDIRLPSDVGMWVATVLGAFWPVQVVVIALLMFFTLLAAGAIDPGTKQPRRDAAPADGTMYG